MRNKISILLGLIALTIISCKKKKTVWNTDWSAPLINDTLSLKNLVNDSTLTTQNGNYFVDLTRTIQSFNLMEQIKIPDTTVVNNLKLSFPVLNVSSGMNFIAEAKEQKLNLPNGVELKEAILSSGIIEFQIKNPIETIAFFKVSLPAAFKNGQVLEKMYPVPAASGGVKGEFSARIDVSGYKIDLTGLNGHERNRFLTNVEVQSDPNGPAVQVTNLDTINVNASFKDVKLSYAKGHFGTNSLSDTATINVDFFNNIQQGFVDFPQSEISLVIENGIKVSAHAKLKSVSNESNSGVIVNLTHPQIGHNLLINPALGSWNSLQPSTASITFNGSNSNIETFLENLASKYLVSYQVNLNPWGNVSSGTEEVFSNSALKLKLKAKLPLSLGLNDLIFQDTFNLNVKQKYEKTHISKGDLIFELANSFPINAGLELKFLNANGNELTTIIPNGTIESAQLGAVDPVSGLMTKESKIVVSLTESQVKALNDTKFLLLRAFANTNDPNGISQQVPIPEGAFLKVILRGNLQTENRF